MLSRLLMRFKEVGNAQSMQQTTNIFLIPPPPTLLGEKKCHGVLTQRSVDKYTKHVRLFIQNISHAWFPIAVLEEDKYVVTCLDEAPRMHFPGVFVARVTEQEFLSLVRHSLRCLIVKTEIPNGVEDFLNAYSEKRSNVDQRQRSAHYRSINTAVGNAPKPAAKPPARGVPVVVPPAPPSPPRPLPQNPLPYTPCLLLYRW